eukprot:4777568-Lingulodinium_polyedra.AAC.1
MAALDGTTPARAKPWPRDARRPATSRTLDTVTLTPSRQGHPHSRRSNDSGAALQWGQVPPP